MITENSEKQEIKSIKVENVKIAVREEKMPILPKVQCWMEPERRVFKHKARTDEAYTISGETPISRKSTEVPTALKT